MMTHQLTLSQVIANFSHYFKEAIGRSRNTIASHRLTVDRDRAIILSLIHTGSRRGTV